MGLDCKLVIWDSEPPREIILGSVTTFKPIVHDAVWDGKRRFTAAEIQERLRSYELPTSEWRNECWEDVYSRKWERIHSEVFWLSKVESLLRGLPDDTPVGIYHTDVEFD